MTAFAFSDCIRATPGRTIGALLLAALHVMRRTSRHPSVGQHDEQGRAGR